MNSHPQRTGRSLFLLWAAGLLVESVLMRGLAAIVNAGASAQMSATMIVFVVVGMLGHAWQAWLLFRPGWRFALWTALPLMMLIMPGNMRWMQMLGIVAPLLQTVALANVRQRPWAWLLAGMGQVVLSVGVGQLVNNLLYQKVVSAAYSPLVTGLILSSVASGLWLAGALVAAAILAWKMPPVTTPESHTSPPPLSGSTGA
jgi:hypothetical protein